LEGEVTIVWYNESKCNFAELAIDPFLKIPYTVEPLPDKLAYIAPKSINAVFLSPIFGYAGKTIVS
jgi:hypothetical protein